MVARGGFARCARKVRAPRRTVAGNTRPPRGEDQRHRDESAVASAAPGETGKLYRVQGQIGGPVRRKPHEERVAPLSGRPLEVPGDRRPRWMAIAALGAVQNSAYRPPR